MLLSEIRFCNNVHQPPGRENKAALCQKNDHTMKTIQQAYNPAYFAAEKKRSVIQRFFAWCTAQEKNRLAWLGGIIAGHGCVFTPLTVLFIVLSGNNPVFWPFAIGAMGLALVTNLAALPTRVTIPVFFLSLLIDLVIIANCVALGFSTPAVG